MLTGIVIGALSAAALIQQTDTIVQADGASRLDLESFQGQVVVRTWDRSAVQIKAEHPDGYSVDVSRSGRTIRVEADIGEARHGLGAVDFDLTVPRSFDLNIEGIAVDVDIQGSEGSIEVMTAHGTIQVSGGRGPVTLESVNGPIQVEDVRGDLSVTGVAGQVTILNCVGDVFAESVGGALALEGITSTDVEVSTVGGDLRFEGTIDDEGRYVFGSHGGPIWLYLPSGTNAQLDVLTLAGSLEVDFPGVSAEPTRESGFPGMRGKEWSVQLGTGSAQIDVETFGGSVHILRSGG